MPMRERRTSPLSCILHSHTQMAFTLFGYLIDFIIDLCPKKALGVRATAELYGSGVLEGSEYSYFQSEQGVLHVMRLAVRAAACLCG